MWVIREKMLHLKLGTLAQRGSFSLRLSPGLPQPLWSSSLVHLNGRERSNVQLVYSTHKGLSLAISLVQPSCIGSGSAGTVVVGESKAVVVQGFVFCLFFRS